MKIGFYSSAPLEDKRNWSGTMFKMYEQIRLNGYEIVWIPTVQYTNTENKIFSAIEKLYNKIFNRGYNQHLFTLKSLIASKKLKQHINRLNVDVIFIPTYINDFAFLNIKQPIIYLNDANVAQLINYYPYYSGLGYFSKKETKFLEKKALLNASAIVYSSDWAADYAIKNYGIEKEKIHVLKFGANITIPEIIHFDKKMDDFTFLFLAVDWERKRGNLAYKALKILFEKGYPIKMKIIGCNPNVKEEWIKIIPFLNKNNPVEFKQLQEYLSTSHFLFVPTKADCTPIAFCEAAGYGLPVISTNTGGVNAHVEPGYNGILLPEEAFVEDYALAIENIINNPEAIHNMTINARKKYDNELNWEMWGKNMNQILQNLQIR